MSEWACVISPPPNVDPIVSGLWKMHPKTSLKKESAEFNNLSDLSRSSLENDFKVEHFPDCLT